MYSNRDIKMFMVARGETDRFTWRGDEGYVEDVN